MSRPPLKNKEVEPVEPVQTKIYQSNTYRKDLSWLHFNDEPRVQERQQVKDEQSCKQSYTYIHICIVYMYIYKHQETYIFILIYYILITSEIVCLICCLLQKRLKADNLRSVTLFSDAFVTAQIIYLLQITE